jgi:nucleoside phosphorylase
MPEADFLIVCALQKERRAILDQLNGLNSESTGGQYDWTNFNQVDGQKATIAVVTLAEMGNVQAGIATTRAIMEFKPFYVILAGIAGGVRTKSRQLGDLLIAEQILGYEYGKVANGVIRRRYKVLRPAFELTMTTFDIEKTNWSAKIKVPRPEETADQRPKIHRGVVASGEKVVADNHLMGELAAVWHELIGIEMEAYGTALATYQANDSPGMLMVKGICDWADKSKGDMWQEYASAASAAFVIELLRAVKIDRSKRTTPNATSVSGQATHPDEDAIRFYWSCFRRPAFEIPYELEYSSEDFCKAIEDTLAALNTGEIQDTRVNSGFRSGSKISELKDQHVSRQMQVINKLLENIRDDYRRAVHTGSIETFEYEGSVYRRSGPVPIVHKFDLLRVEILERFNAVCASAGVPKLTIVLSKQEGDEVEIVCS